MTDEYKVKFTVVLKFETHFDSEITADGVLQCLEQDFYEEMELWDILDSKVIEFECTKIEEG